MLFGCGMGVGLVFWGVAEPISFYVSPAAGIAPETPEAANFALKAAFMHWGVSPWANYAIMGLGLAYFGFRKKQTHVDTNGSKAGHYSTKENDDA